MPKSHKYPLGLLLLLGLFSAPALAGAGQPQAGQSFPMAQFNRPQPAAEARYLGLEPGQAAFKLGQVKAQAVLLEVFSMYCPICQVDAPRMNEMFQMIQARGLGERLKIMGLGAGNSETEVGVYRDKFKTPFPLLADGDYQAHKALGEPRTPFYILVSLRPEGPRVVYARLGSLGEPGEFLKTLLEKAELQ